MKKIIRFNLFVLVGLLILSCGEHKKATTTDDLSTDNTTSTENVDIKTTSKKERPKKPADPNDPPKYATKALAMEFLLTKYNNPKAPLSQEQIDQINDIANNLNVTTFRNQYSYSRFRRRIVTHIKSDILTPEQLLLFPGRTKAKNNVKR